MLFQSRMTGVFVVAAAVAFAGGWMQRDAVAWLMAEPAASHTDAARTAVPTVPEAERVARSPASAPGADDAEAASARPIVTVNGRPLAARSEVADETPAAPVSAVPTSKAEAEAEPEASREVALVAPQPVPRPEGLSVPKSGQKADTEPQGRPIDYEAITAVANGARNGPDTGFMSYEERAALAPLPGRSQPMPGRAGQDELVAVVGPQGETIWVYQDQIDSVTRRTDRPVSDPGNPYGFVYDDYDFRQ